MAGQVPIRIVVADNRPLVRELLAQAISDGDQFVASMLSGESAEVVSALRTAPADVVIFGTDAIDASAEDFVHAVLLACPHAAVIALAAADRDPQLLDALGAGASGFITLDTPLIEVAERLLAAASRQTLLPADFAQRMLDGMRVKKQTNFERSLSPSLTARENEILKLLTLGLGNAEIARRLGVSTNTVKNHLYSIYRKLGVKSRGQAFATAMSLGLQA